MEWIEKDIKLSGNCVQTELLLINAFVFDIFAIHRSVNPKFHYRNKNYTVTHIPSGYALIQLPNHGACMEFVNEIKDLSWADLTGKNNDVACSCRFAIDYDTAEQLFTDISKYKEIAIRFIKKYHCD